MNKLMNMVFTILMIGMSSSCLSNSKGYTLKGELKGAPDGTAIALVPYAKYDVKPEAETTIEGGKFLFQGTVPEPREFFLILGAKEAYYRVMIENTSITIKGEVVKHQGQGETKDYYTFENMKVTGSQSNDYFYSQMAVKDGLGKIYETNRNAFADISTLLQKARGNKDETMMDSITALPRYKEMEDAEKKFFAEVEKRYNEVFEANKETFWGPLMMLNLFSYFTPDVRPTFDMMSKEAKESFYGKMVAEDLYPENRTGEKIPDFTTTDANGNDVTLNDLIKDKKVILIDFWASWCMPCRKELPNVKANYEKYASKGFEVIGFSIDKDAKAWQKALEEEGLDWPNFNDLDVSSLYKVKAVPTTYLIDSEGRLIADNVRGEELGKKLAELLGE